MQKENITIESSTKEFSEIVEKAKNLKNNIEKEINDINILYEKTINDLTKSFEEKIKKLKKEENDIKEKLENEVTKVKEKLEIFLTETNNQININEKINKGFKKLENGEKNMITILSYVSKINKNKKQMNLLLKETIKSIKFSYKGEKSNIEYEEFYFNEMPKLKNIGPAKLEFNYGGNTQGRILFDISSDKVYYIDNYTNDKINIYENYENFKSNKLNKSIKLQSYISGTYSVIHKDYFYYFEFKQNQTNKLIKYDLEKNKILNYKNILSDAVLGNSQNCWGGNNDIILVSDNLNLYAVYSSNNNNKRISIAKIDDNNLNIIKIWNTDSLEKDKCGPIFMINNILYHIKTYNNENDSVIYSYNLLNEKSNKINIPFENKGWCDSSLTYYPHLKCLMTINNRKLYKYEVNFENEE